ncbi:hypothetical protein [Rhodocyclus gracilis]|uniref:Uncharacterized protein n=1 Tax=Rhodocyclus tenuis TaxID=1066 RepID=A0A6L5JUG0_RHOTE|nr:hypothetical protein [Rhodocyclus gracilis]MQY51013.1 hypothetical protein [Rhodocyclus gracilis]
MALPTPSHASTVKYFGATALYVVEDGDGTLLFTDIEPADAVASESIAPAIAGRRRDGRHAGAAARAAGNVAAAPSPSSPAMAGASAAHTDERLARVTPRWPALGTDTGVDGEGAEAADGVAEDPQPAHRDGGVPPDDH